MGGANGLLLLLHLPLHLWSELASLSLALRGYGICYFYQKITSLT